MSSDSRADSETRRPDRTFTQIGVGLHNSFQCGECQVKKSQYGRKMRRLTKGPLRGLSGWICRDCASICLPAIPAVNSAPPQAIKPAPAASVRWSTETGAA